MACRSSSADRHSSRVPFVERTTVRWPRSSLGRYNAASGLRGLERRAIPMRQIRGGFIAALQKREKLLFGNIRRADRVAGQDEFVQHSIIVGLGRLHGGVAETFRLRIGVAVEERIGRNCTARPEPAATHFV